MFSFGSLILKIEISSKKHVWLDRSNGLNLFSGITEGSKLSLTDENSKTMAIGNKISKIAKKISQKIKNFNAFFFNFLFTLNPVSLDENPILPA